jgi:hypothetical protein
VYYYHNNKSGKKNKRKKSSKVSKATPAAVADSVARPADEKSSSMTATPIPLEECAPPTKVLAERTAKVRKDFSHLVTVKK